MVDTVRANNTTVAGGPLFAVDSISGSTYAITKLVLGADNVDDGLIHSSNPLPVTAPGVVSTYAVNAPSPAGTQSTWVVGAVKTSTHIASQTGPVSTFAVNSPTPAGVQSTHIVGQTNPVSTYSVNSAAGASEYSTKAGFNQTTGSLTMMGALSDYATASSGVVTGSTQPLYTDSTGALVVRDLSAAASNANPNSSWSMGSAVGSVPVSTYSVGGGVVSTFIVSVPLGNAEYSTKSGFNQTTGSFVMIGALSDYATASSGVVTGSTQPFYTDSTGALVVRDLSAAASNANPNSSFVMGSAVGSVPVSTFSVNSPAPSGTQSTWVRNSVSSSVLSTFAVAGSAKTSTHIASQTGPVSTFAVNKTSTHIAGQTGPVSTFAVGGTASSVPVAVSTGGLSIAHKLSLTTGVFQIKNGPAQLHQLWFTNTATSTRWLYFFDNGNPTVGTTPPTFAFGLPSMSSFSNAVSGFMPSGPYGIQFGTSTFVACNAQQGTNSAVAPASNEVTVNIFYK